MSVQLFNPLSGQFDLVGSNTPTPGVISITGNDENTQTGSNFNIVGINGFQLNWNTDDSEFEIIPPNSFTWGATTVSSTSAALLAGNRNILTNPSMTTVSLPANAGTVVGDLVEVIGLSGGFTISQAADQQIFIGEETSSVGISGSVSCSGSLRSAITLSCVSNAGGTYIWGAVIAPQGNFTVI